MRQNCLLLLIDIEYALKIPDTTNKSQTNQLHLYRLYKRVKGLLAKFLISKTKEEGKSQSICCTICTQSMSTYATFLDSWVKKRVFFRKVVPNTCEGMVSVSNFNGWPDWVCQQCVRSQAPATLKLPTPRKMDQDQFCHFLDEPTFLFFPSSVRLCSSSLCLQPWHLSKSAPSPPPKTAGAVPHMSRSRNPVWKTAARCWAWFILAVCSIINGFSVLQLSHTFLMCVCVYLSARALASQHCCLDLFTLWTGERVFLSSFEMCVCVYVWYILQTFALHVCLSFVLNYYHSSQIKLSPFPCHVILQVIFHLLFSVILHVLPSPLNGHISVILTGTASLFEVIRQLQGHFLLRQVLNKSGKLGHYTRPTLDSSLV